MWSLACLCHHAGGLSRSTTAMRTSYLHTAVLLLICCEDICPRSYELAARETVCLEGFLQHILLPDTHCQV